MVVKNETSHNPVPYASFEEVLGVPGELCRNMTGSEKFEIAMELSDIRRLNVRAEIRQRYPDYTEDMITQAYLNLMLDKDFVKGVFGGRELKP